MKKFIYILSIFLLFSVQPASAGNPLKDIRNGLEKVRSAVDHSYAKKQAKKEARNQITAEKNRQLKVIDGKISSLQKQKKTLINVDPENLEVSMIESLIQFNKKIKLAVQKEFDRKIAAV